MRPGIVLLLALSTLWPTTGAAQGRDDGERYDNTLAKDFVMDAPWRVMDAQTAIPLIIVLKDCDEDDIRELHWICCTDLATGAQVWRHDYGDEQIGDDASEDNYWTWITTVTENHSWLPDGTLLTPANLGYSEGDDIDWLVEIYYRDDWFNYTEERHLRVRVGGGAFPWPEDWFGGDTHFHSMYTNNIAEYGLPLPAAKAAAGAMGLHWITVTDHSCDLDETGDGSFSYATHQWEFTLQDETGIHANYRDVFAHGSSWGGLGADVAELSDAGVRLYRGVEINLASVDPDSWDKTLHCLFYHDEYIASGRSGALGERPVEPSLPAGLAQLSGGGFAYAAHPLDDLSAEWGGLDWGVNGTVWGDQDLATALNDDAFRGIEAFNTRETLRSADQYDPWDDFDAGQPADDPYPAELLAGIATWDQLLAGGMAGWPPRKIFLAGGSDAHGDLNFATYLGLDSYATDNALGKVQTVVRVPGDHAPGDLPAMGEILEAYRQGRSTVTDGPFLEMSLDLDRDGQGFGDGDLGHGGDALLRPELGWDLHLRWASLPEFGPVEELRVFAGDANGVELALTLLPSAGGQGWSGSEVLDLAALAPDEPCFLRAELETADGAAGHRAYTNPLWLEWDADTSTPPAAAGRLEAWPNPFNPRVEIRFVLPEDGFARLRVLDAEGRLLRVLEASENLPAGEHRLVWDGLDGRGHGLPSGVYLLSLEADGTLQRKKLILLR